MNRIGANDFFDSRNINLDLLEKEEYEQVMDQYQEQVQLLVDFLKDLELGIEEKDERKVDLTISLSKVNGNELQNIENVVIFDGEITSIVQHELITLNVITQNEKTESLKKLNNILQHYNDLKDNNEIPVLAITIMKKGIYTKFVSLNSPVYYCKNSTKVFHKENAVKFLFTLANCALVDIEG
jgi:hypothetical protein